MATIATKSITIKSARLYPNSTMLEVIVTGTDEGLVFNSDDLDPDFPLEDMVKLYYRWARKNGFTLPQTVGKVITFNVTAV